MNITSLQIHIKEMKNTEETLCENYVKRKT